MSDENRRPFPQLNGLRSWVSDELKSRKRTWPTAVSSPFVRMTSCNEDDVNNYKYFSMGLHGYDGGASSNLFELTHGSKRDIVGYAQRGGQKILIGADELKYMSPTVNTDRSIVTESQRIANEQRLQQAQTQQSDSVTAQGAHPIPGITSVNVKRTGLTTPLTVDVRWQCYNQQQLEFLRNHFLVIGNYIVLEWGQKFHDDARRNKKLLDFSDSDTILRELLTTVVSGRRYVIDNFNKANDGNYDFIVAQVSNFTIELDAAKNIYKCSTKLVSVGENMWGLSTDKTTTVINKTDTTNVNKLSDIHSYFEGQGSRFNQLLGKLEETSNGVKYCRPQQPAFKFNANTAADTGQVSPNPHDAAFISWTALTEDVMNDIIHMFDGLSTDVQTKSMYDKLRKDLRSLLGLGSKPDRNLPPEIRDVQDRLYEQEFIGNHKYLRTTEPNSIIIITPELAKNNVNQNWLGNGVFGEDGDDTKGRLSSGIWLNAEMVREAFLKTTTLQSAIEQILSRMNVAVGDYWQLRLFYDDEISVYKVIDYKYEKEFDATKFYVFNSHMNDHHNDVFDIKFDSAFPPELIMQMMAVSMIQTSSPSKQQEIFDQYPLINNTSPFMFAVNWTSLRDVLKEQIKSYRDGYGISPGNTVKISGTGLQNNESNNIAVTARINAERNKGSQTAKTPVEAGTEGTSRSIDGTLSSIPRNPDIPSAPLPRDSVVPPVSLLEPLSLDSLPITPNPTLVITSPIGARNLTNPRASKDHRGVDIRAAQGTPVYATKSGKVDQMNSNSSTAGGLLVLGHIGGFQTKYMHLSRIVVRPGETIRNGQLVGYSGGARGTSGAGNSEVAHLHFEMLKHGVPVNPVDSLAKLGNVAVKNPDGSETPYKPQSNVQTSQANIPYNPLQPPKSPNVPSNTTVQNSEGQLIDPALKRDNEYKIKFGNNILNLIYPTVSLLRNKITQDGYENIKSNKPNAFISPFPTKTSVELKIQGIAGISISDGFMVDKLPFIFANYGVFQVTEISDSITHSGWYTTIRGYFKLLWTDGRGGNRDE